MRSLIFSVLFFNNNTSISYNSINYISFLSKRNDKDEFEIFTMEVEL